ncbi:MAG TPA: 4Fe-4S binding protein [Candidatus Methylomirabilis sp.]|nr:4Fe-4S binding protein [Candidatus Methylomirabilis sp.]
MAVRFAFSIDLDRCIGCQACAAACRTGNELAPGETFIAISDVVRDQAGSLWGSFTHERCFHCGSAPCVTVCPTGALSKWNGLTVIEPGKCSGCGYCTDACPFKVPHIIANSVSKCTACLGLRDRVVPVLDVRSAQLLKRGQDPWCAQTCPSQAIKFGERDSLLAAAKARVADLRPRYPNAQVYGETQLDGLGLLLILLDQPDVYGLPPQPETPVTLRVWKGAVQPATTGLSALAAVSMGLMFLIARRQHAREKAELHGPDGAAPAAQPEEAHVTGQDHD